MGGQDISIKYGALDRTGRDRLSGSPTKNVKTGENGRFLYRAKGRLLARERVDQESDASALRLTKGGLRIGI